MNPSYFALEEKLAAERREKRYEARVFTRNMREYMAPKFSEAYWAAMNAVEDSGVCFIALSGNRVTVKDGRRTEHKPGEPIYLGNDEEGLASYYIPGGF